MQPTTKPDTNDSAADWPSLVEFKQSRFPDYDPSTDTEAEQSGNGESLDFYLPDKLAR